MKNRIKENENVILSVLGAGLMVSLAFLILKKHKKTKDRKHTWKKTDSFFDNEIPTAGGYQAYSETGILL